MKKFSKRKVTAGVRDVYERCWNNDPPMRYAKVHSNREWFDEVKTIDDLIEAHERLAEEFKAYRAADIEVAPWLRSHPDDLLGRSYATRVGNWQDMIELITDDREVAERFGFFEDPLGFY
jgi:hypothetical protein